MHVPPSSLTDTGRLTMVIFHDLKQNAWRFFKGHRVAVFQAFIVQALRQPLIGSANVDVPQVPASVAAALSFSLIEPKR